MRELPPEAVNVAADAIEAHPDWNLPWATAEAMARAALEAAGPVTEALVIGYLVDGNVWHPSDVTIVRRETTATATKRPTEEL
jgi:hypothetical protein